MTPYDEYPKFPVETLAEGWGDCEDSSILYAALMRAAGYDVILLELPRHMAVGVALSKPILGSFVVYKGKMYFYAETTGSGWLIGMTPKAYANQKVKAIPIPKNPEGTQLKLKKLVEEVAYTPERFKQLETQYNQLMKKNLELLSQIAELQAENSQLKMQIENLNFQIMQLNNTVTKLREKAVKLDQLIGASPIIITFAIVAVIGIAVGAYYEGRSAERKELLGI